MLSESLQLPAAMPVIQPLPEAVPGAQVVCWLRWLWFTPSAAIDRSVDVAFPMANHTHESKTFQPRDALLGGVLDK